MYINSKKNDAYIGTNNVLLAVFLEAVEIANEIEEQIRNNRGEISFENFVN